MDADTAMVLTLDLKHLTDAELEWLHDLNNRIQKRSLRLRAKEKLHESATRSYNRIA